MLQGRPCQDTKVEEAKGAGGEATTTPPTPPGKG